MKYTFSFFLLRICGIVLGILTPSAAAVFIYLQRQDNLLFSSILLLCAAVIALLLYKTRHLHYSMHYIDNMNGEQFEKYLMYWFRQNGYSHIKITQKTRDYGADLLMKKGLRRIAVQAKRYDRNIGVHAVQQALGSKAYYHCSDAMVVTNQYFTISAKRLAKANDVILVDRYTLFNIPQKS